MWLTARKRGKISISVFFLAAHGFDPRNKILISVILTSFLIFIPIGSKAGYGVRNEEGGVGTGIVFGGLQPYHLYRDG